MICDAGAVGPDYIPGHAHGDVFSFELSVRNQRIIVDGGVFDYAASEMRRYCRSTPAHNTVTLDGEDQSEFWGVFRVARRAGLHDVIWSPSATGFRLQGWHDGYQRVHANARHIRQFTWHNEGILLVRDEIQAGNSTEAVSRIHLHPNCQIIATGRDSVELNTLAGAFHMRFAGPGRLKVEDSFYCPEFGRRFANQALAWTAQGTNLRFGFCFAPGHIEAFDLDEGATVAGQTHRW